MIGVLWRSQGGRVRLERSALGGLPVIKALVPEGGRQSRRMGGAVRLLARAGVRRIIANRELDGGEWLERWGLRCLDAAALYRYMAPELTLAWLAVLGLEPEKTVVVLHGEQVSWEMARAAQQLCPRVRGIQIRAGAGSARLQQRLYARYGMVVDGLWQGAAVTVYFDGNEEGNGLCLTGPGCLRLVAEGVTVPQELEEESFLCAMWQCGQLREGQLRVVANKTS